MPCGVTHTDGNGNYCVKGRFGHFQETADLELCEREEFNYFHINIPDYGTPTDNQLLKFLEITGEITDNKEPIVVHCVAGCGRSGLMIVAWAAYNGYIHHGMDPVKWIRKKRPCCLETKEQMELAQRITKKYRKSIM